MKRMTTPYAVKNQQMSIASALNTTRQHGLWKAKKCFSQYTCGLLTNCTKVDKMSFSYFSFHFTSVENASYIYSGLGRTLVCVWCTLCFKKSGVKLFAITSSTVNCCLDVQALIFENSFSVGKNELSAK